MSSHGSTAVIAQPSPSVATGDTTQPKPAPHWWQVKWMWLVVGIPATTVVAALATIVLAVATYDPPVRGTGDPVHIRQAHDTPSTPR